MEVNEFINRIITIGFDKKTVVAHAAKWDLSIHEGSDIYQNSLIMQWYATQIYISTRILSHKLPLEKISTFYLLYDSSLRASEFIQKENKESQEVIRLKMAQHRVQYNYVYTVNDPRDILEHAFIQEIGKCFARLCNQEESMEFSSLGTDLFSNCMSRCINEFKYEKIEFIQLSDLTDEH